MPLQNRVDPFGRIHAVPERGMFTGNRGVIHDPETRTLLRRRWTTKAWLICRCDYKGMRREPMGRNARSGGAGWTELFFLDEVTALAAGHRPCFLCRREPAKDFARCFGLGHARPTPSAPEMDARLHRERLASGAETPTLGRTTSLPPRRRHVRRWRHSLCGQGRTGAALEFDGYGQPRDMRDFRDVGLRLLTPATTVECCGPVTARSGIRRRLDRLAQGTVYFCRSRSPCTPVPLRKK